MKTQSQNGIAHLGLLLLLLVAAVIALVGYKVSNNQKPSAVSTQVSTKARQVIRSTADLNSAESSLNQTNLDSDLNPDALNNDINTLL